MNTKNQSAELSYYGLYLLNYLKENQPDRATDTDFINLRADHAAVVYEQSRLEGYTPDGAQELAMAALVDGLHFSTYLKELFRQPTFRNKRFGDVFVILKHQFRVFLVPV